MRERRRERRAPAAHLRDLPARVRPGHAVSIVDLSPSGALVEASRPLRPGTRVEMHIGAGHTRTTLAALVVRCLVAAFDADSVTYRAGLAFDERCSLMGEQTAPDGDLVPWGDGGK